MESDYKVRPAHLGDAPELVGLYAPYVLNTDISFEVVPPDEDAFIKKITNPYYPFLVCEVEDEVVGFAYACQHRERKAYRYSADASVYVHSDCHRKGIGRRLYSCLFSILAAQGYHTIIAGITDPNEKSVGLHTSLGFVRVGTYHNVGYKHGKWLDVTWFEKRLKEYETPGEIKRCDEISDFIKETLSY